MSRFKALIVRSGIVAGMLLAAAPIAAQDNSAAAPPPAAAENIGPRELSNFSLGGTVTRRAEPAPQPAAAPPREAGARPSASPGAASSEGPRRATTAVAGPRSPSVAASATDSVPSRPAARSPSNPAPATIGSTPALSRPMSAQPLPGEASTGFSPLPWIAALLLLAGGTVIYFGVQRQKGRQAAAVAADFARIAKPQPNSAHMPAARSAEPLVRRPAPQPTPRAPAPSGAVTSSLRASPQPAGVVAASLRPWIELELEPSQALVSDEHAAIAFDVTLFNSGSAPARDVAVEACLINAGQQQDVQLSEFYASPGEVHDKIPMVEPLTRITLKSAVRLTRAAIQEYEVEGRKLFMPMVAISSRYRWSSGEGQSGASFLVGSAANDSAKLAPLRLDQGARGWKSLAARRYEKGIRR